MSREQIEGNIIRIMRPLGLVFFIAIIAFPLYWMALASVTPTIKLLTDPTNLGINLRDISLKAFAQVWSEYGFGRYFLNSGYVSVLTVLLTVTLATAGAYAIARLRFRGRTLLCRSILLIYMFPAIVLAVPLFVIFTKLQLRNELHGLIIVYLAQTLPVALYMLYSYFKTLPVDLEEAGLTDGCSRLGVIWRITVPLGLPAMVSVALYTFMIAWNEFLFAFLFLDSPAKFTLSRGIVQIADNVNVSQQLTMAAAMIATVPIVFLILLFQRYLVKGLTAGGVKG
jgi:multiple sugar transport system permease protein